MSEGGEADRPKAHNHDLESEERPRLNLISVEDAEDAANLVANFGRQRSVFQSHRRARRYTSHFPLFEAERPVPDDSIAPAAFSETRSRSSTPLLSHTTSADIHEAGAVVEDHPSETADEAYHHGGAITQSNSDSNNIRSGVMREPAAEGVVEPRGGEIDSRTDYPSTPGTSSTEEVSDNSSSNNENETARGLQAPTTPVTLNTAETHNTTSSYTENATARTLQDPSTAATRGTAGTNNATSSRTRNSTARALPAPSTPATSTRGWTPEQEAALAESVRYVVGNGGLEELVWQMWEIIAERVNEVHGVQKTMSACRNWYNRRLRKKTGFDERKTPNPDSLVSCSQEGKKKDGPKRKKDDDDGDEDDKKAPKRARMAASNLVK
ncbi:hypothetical protein IWZ00DRAFT_534232 [Phyllosticta capitalensis]|uniref:Myb-like domain-containing protein n=1 Tax=Phyllosticta capitalensis TaxID=121624 RepID=A0ABR1YBA3_9PEZI